LFSLLLLTLQNESDISLENFAIDDNDNYVLIDFGMCLKIPTDTAEVTDDNGTTVSFIKSYPIKPQGQCGKHNYMSPEIYRNDSFDGESVDVWSLGVIFFMLLSGKHPYKWSHPSDELFIQTTKNLDAYLRSHGVFISRSGLDLMEGILQETPSQRLKLSTILCHPWLTE
jgi:serine/threonine protein kinase